VAIVSAVRIGRVPSRHRSMLSRALERCERRHSRCAERFVDTPASAELRRWAMNVRRVVTGHTPENKAIVVSDEEVSTMQIGERGTALAGVWGTTALTRSHAWCR
jgi:hypothetical protein